MQKRIKYEEIYIMWINENIKYKNNLFQVQIQTEK